MFVMIGLKLARGRAAPGVKSFMQCNGRRAGDRPIRWSSAGFKSRPVGLW